MSSIEEKYSKLQHKLPAFSSLNNDFEIAEIEKPIFLLRSILRKIVDKLEVYAALLAEIIQPDTSSVAGMHETQAFSEAEKKHAYDLFKKVMKAHRNCIILILENKEEAQAAFLIAFSEEWQVIKEELVKAVDTMKDSWDRTTSVKNDVGYFG